MRQPEKSDDLLVQGAIIVITLLGVILLSAFGRPAAPLAIAGVSILLLLRFGIISNLIVKAFGAEVAITRAEEVTKEAEEATRVAEEAAAKAEQMIEDLKALGGMLTTYSVLEMALNKGSNITTAMEARETLSEYLINLDSEMGQTVREGLKRPIIVRLVMDAVNSLQMGEGFVTLVFEVSEFLKTDPVDFAEVRVLVEQYGITDDVKKQLDRAEQFQKTGKLI